MIKTVVFDIGNVLADFAWEPFLRSFDFTEEVFAKMVKATVKSPEWNEFDRGALSTEEIIESFIRNDPSIEKEIRLIFQDLRGIVTKRDYAIRWIQHLKAQGLQVLYLSNFAEITRAHCQDALEFMQYTDGGIMSYQIKQIKPDAVIYEALMEKYHLNPEECVFLDDTWPNIEAAAKLGFHTVHVTSHAAALQGLAALGVTPYTAL